MPLLISGHTANTAEQILQALGHAFADASHRLSEKIVHGLLPTLRSARDGCHVPESAFITGFVGSDDACKRFEEIAHGNAQVDATEVSPPNFFIPAYF